ncbi:MAG: fasciclin domain-containing protein [Sumerlaeia bacterium]
MNGLQTNLTKWFPGLCATALALTLPMAAPSGAFADHHGTKDAEKPKADIVETAVAADGFNTLVAAVQAAGLVDALKGEGPFTVFAPTDEAFAALPEGTVETLLKPENKELLVSILTYHVVSGKVKAKNVVELDHAETLNGQRVDIEVTDAGVKVDGANVVATDIKASNGIIHVIDAVILPESKDLVDLAMAHEDFNTLGAAVGAAGLAEALRGEGPFTIFAPTDAAFAALPDGTVEGLLEPGAKDQLAGILKYHVVPGRIYSDQALKAGSATTLEGGDLKIVVKDGVAMVNGAKIVQTDIEAANGVIHVIDGVLLPSAKDEVAASKPASKPSAY